MGATCAPGHMGATFRIVALFVMGATLRILGCHTSHCLVVRLRSVQPIMISGTDPSMWGRETCCASQLRMLARLRPKHSWQNFEREVGSWERPMPFSW